MSLSAYELQRNKNIADNRVHLRSLGLEEAQPSAAASKRPRREAPSHSQVAPSRSSSRPATIASSTSADGSRAPPPPPPPRESATLPRIAAGYRAARASCDQSLSQRVREVKYHSHLLLRHERLQGHNPSVLECVGIADAQLLTRLHMSHQHTVTAAAVRRTQLGGPLLDSDANRVQPPSSLADAVKLEAAGEMVSRHGHLLEPAHPGNCGYGGSETGYHGVAYKHCGSRTLCSYRWLIRAADYSAPGSSTTNDYAGECETATDAAESRAKVLDKLGWGVRVRLDGPPSGKPLSSLGLPRKRPHRQNTSDFSATTSDVTLGEPSMSDAESLREEGSEDEGAESDGGPAALEAETEAVAAEAAEVDEMTRVLLSQNTDVAAEEKAVKQAEAEGLVLIRRQGKCGPTHTKYKAVYCQHQNQRHTRNKKIRSKYIASWMEEGVSTELCGYDTAAAAAAAYARQRRPLAETGSLSGKWSAAEHARLKAAVAKLAADGVTPSKGGDFSQIAKQLPGRTECACYQYYRKNVFPRRLAVPLAKGTRIRVWWLQEQRWFSGSVRAYKHTHCKVDPDTHLVLYDDGDQEYEPLGDPLPYRWEYL